MTNVDGETGVNPYHKDVAGLKECIPMCKDAVVYQPANPSPGIINRDIRHQMLKDYANNPLIMVMDMECAEVIFPGVVFFMPTEPNSKKKQQIGARATQACHYAGFGFSRHIPCYIPGMHPI